MKKAIYYLFLLILISCSDETVQQIVTNSDLNTDTLRFKSIQDDITGKYKTLGFGIDATEPYLEYTYDKLQVIDVKKLIAERSYEYFYGEPAANRTFVFSGSDALDFSSEISRKYSGSIPIEGLTLGVKADITSSNLITSKYSYATCFANFYLKHMKLHSTQEVFNNYLTVGFSNAINTLSCEEIIKRYGTHVKTDIYTGGKLVVEYKSIINSDTKKKIVNAGISASVEKVFDVSIENKEDLSLKDQNSTYECKFKTDGGNPTSSFTGVITENTSSFSTSSWTNWTSSINESNSVCIEIGDNSLIPIYEFVTNSEKKAELKNAVENYIASKKINLISVVPLYMYKNTGTQNHFYTTDFSELGYGYEKWEYKKIAAFVCENQLTNTVPLHRFYRVTKEWFKTYFNHYYTREYSSGTKNYNYEGIECYVYPTQSGATKPLYQLWNPSTHDHYYTTDKNDIPSGYGSQTTCCYVY